MSRRALTEGTARAVSHRPASRSDGKNDRKSEREPASGDVGDVGNSGRGKSQSAPERGGGGSEQKAADPTGVARRFAETAPKSVDHGVCRLRVTLFNANCVSIDEVVRILRRVTQKTPTDLVLFPESFVPSVVDPEQKIATWRRAKTTEDKARMLLVGACVALGVDCLVGGRDYTARGILNSVWYVDRHFRTLHKYDKRNIVEHDRRGGSPRGLLRLTTRAFCRSRAQTRPTDRTCFGSRAQPTLVAQSPPRC